MMARVGKIPFEVKSPWLLTSGLKCSFSLVSTSEKKKKDMEKKIQEKKKKGNPQEEWNYDRQTDYYGNMEGVVLMT